MALDLQRSPDLGNIERKLTKEKKELRVTFNSSGCKIFKWLGLLEELLIGVNKVNFVQVLEDELFQTIIILIFTLIKIEALANKNSDEVILLVADQETLKEGVKINNCAQQL
ncbi:hypothetical protein ACTXT7_013058 [Hymenolepis weldensis]